MTLECRAGLKIAIDRAERGYQAALDAHQEADAAQLGAELNALWEVWKDQQISRIWTFTKDLTAQSIGPSGVVHVH